MSVDQLHQAVRRLHETADALEAGISTRSPSTSVNEPTSREPSPSTARIVVRALAHTAAAVAALGALFALGDPLLPRPDGSALERPVEVAAHHEVAEPIPPLGANQP